MTAPFQAATLEATLERITYANEDTGYIVAKVDTGRGGELVTVVGSLLGARPGEALRLRGRWGSHPQYGRQFQVADFTTVLPATVQGVRRYLGSGLIKGIGPKLADSIVDHFGVAALEVIETAPQRLVEVPNLGAETDQVDHRGLGGTEGDQGGDGVPAGRRGVHLVGGADLQTVRGRLDRRGPHGAVPVGRGRVGSGSRPRTPSRRRSGSRTTESPRRVRRLHVDRNDATPSILKPL